MSGRKDYVSMTRFCQSRAAVFKKLFGIEKIPSHDTFNRIFKIIDPDHFEALDRQAIRFDFNSALGVVAMDGMGLGTPYTHDKDGKGSEHLAMLTLVKALHLKGSTVTVDAMGTTAEMAAAISAKGGDYV